MSADAGHRLRGLLPGAELRVVLVTATGLAQHAARLHGARSTSGAALAQTIVGGALLAGLGKDGQRVTLQVEGDGPLRGAFADASADGGVRAWLKVPEVELPGDPMDLSPSLGRKGYLSVLRELASGEFYRGSVEIDRKRLDGMLEHYFALSEQVPTAVAIDVRLGPDGTVARASGLLVQKLPDGDEAAVAALRRELAAGAFAAALEAPGGVLAAIPSLAATEVLERCELVYRCTCSRERALRGVASAGRAEILDMIATDGGAVLTCEFCRAVYRFDAAELRALLAGDEPPQGPSA